MTDVDELRHERRRYYSDHPGHPLGRGMPMGRTFRLDVWHEPSQSWRGESHLMAWERRLRFDICAYCGGEGGTVDHLVPKRLGRSQTHSWTNLVGACSRCNERKGARSLLHFLWLRKGG